MKRVIMIISIAAFLFGNGWEDYFHTAAYYYTKGQIKEAGIVLQDGLKLYPDNPQLNALNGLLSQQKEQDQQQDQSQGDSQKKNDDQESQSNQDSQSQQEKKPPKEGNQSSQDDQQQQNQDQEEASPENADSSQNSEEKAEQKASSAEDDEKMAQEKQNAAAILDALKQDEKIHQKRIISRKRSRKLKKDW
ncbi:MAG: hypothetical protein ACE5D8_01615 [Fidelibacterota bacterium]